MIVAIALAAGLSRRMGQNKLLLPYASSTIIEHILDQLCASAVDQVYVVLGHQASRVAEKLAHTRASIVHNPDYERGMLSSVRCGVAAAPAACDAYLIALGDQPAITHADVNVLIAAFRNSDKGIFVPEANGRRGHPILITARYKNEILSRHDQVGLRGLLHAHATDILAVPVESPGITLDVDTPEDYARALNERRP